MNTPISPVIDKHLTKFLITLIFVALISTYFAVNLPKGSVWANHLADGILFLDGMLPRTPAYPMWGYSLLAGVLKDWVIFLQFILVLLIFGLWYKSLAHLRESILRDTKANTRAMSPIAAALVIAPFVCLSISFFSNALAQLFAFAGTWVLYLAVEEDRPIVHYLLAGFLVGLGYQFRSEILLLAGILFIASIVYLASNHRPFMSTFAFVIMVFLMTFPWIAYTKHTIGEARLTSTNGGGAIYEGLGILSKNPWGILEDDDYIEKVAADNQLGSPWSAAASAFFSRKYVESILNHPTSFVKRVLLGWRYMITQGTYLPKFRLLFAEDSRDANTLLYTDERFRQILHLNVHEEQLEKLNKAGISDTSISVRHFIIVASEYIVRIGYAASFLLMFGWSAFLTYRNRFKSFAAAIFVAYSCFLLFGAGFMQTNPRHTTIIVPILLLTICILPCYHVKRGVRGRKLGFQVSGYPST